MTPGSRSVSPAAWPVRFRCGPGRVILVSDTHLSPAAPEAEANWDAVLRYVGAAAPGLVIHLGDLTLDGTRDPGDLRHGRRQLDRLPVAWRAVPGNHDIGDNPGPGMPDSATVDAGRLQRWLDWVGADRWALTVNGWTLLAGVIVNTCGSRSFRRLPAGPPRRARPRVARRACR